MIFIFAYCEHTRRRMTAQTFKVFRIFLLVFCWHRITFQYSKDSQNRWWIHNDKRTHSLYHIFANIFSWVCMIQNCKVTQFHEIHSQNVYFAVISCSCPRFRTRSVARSLFLSSSQSILIVTDSYANIPGFDYEERASDDIIYRLWIVYIVCM